MYKYCTFTLVLGMFVHTWPTIECDLIHVVNTVWNIFTQAWLVEAHSSNDSVCSIYLKEWFLLKGWMETGIYSMLSINKDKTWSVEVDIQGLCVGVTVCLQMHIQGMSSYKPSLHTTLIYTYAYWELTEGYSVGYTLLLESGRLLYHSHVSYSNLLLYVCHWISSVSSVALLYHHHTR